MEKENFQSPLLSVKNLSVCFGQDTAAMPVVNDIDFEIQRHRTFALVGESGSGKSLTALSVMRLLPDNARISQGQVLLGSEDLLRIPENRMCGLRGRSIGMVFQDPLTSLNPVMSVGGQIAECVARHSILKSLELRHRVLELMEQVEIPSARRRYDEYPHQLSGGQRQRIVIAMALAGRPELLIADEPTTALDVTIQARILKLLQDIQKQNGMALWLITHDLGIVDQMADVIAVMHRGRIVESSSKQDLFRNPKQAYTRKLFDALPAISHCCSQPSMDTKLLLEVKGLKVHYPIRKGVLKRVVDQVKAVDGVDFSLGEGRTLALVGESGCGKTTLGKALLCLIPTSNGSVLLNGENLTQLSEPKLRQKRSEIQMVFQDPFSSMNPRMLVGDIIEEGIRAQHRDYSESQRRKRVRELLHQVDLPVDARQRYPHEFSGGQRQRICIARALAVEPKLIVCDEPTSALDVSVQAKLLKLLKKLQKDQGLSYLFISHDLAVVAEMADEVAVMYQGQIVEMGATSRVMNSPLHSYTKKLLEAVPQLNS